MRRRFLSYGLLALTATTTLGAIAAHRLLDRPGESAFALVPADALGVMSLDLVPAPDQVVAFRNIDATLRAANDGRTDTGSLLATVFNDPWMKPLVENVDRSIAVAYLPDPAKKDDGAVVAFIALKDSAAFQETLQKRGKPERTGGIVGYWMMEGKERQAMVMVRDGYAIVSDKAWPLVAVGRVAANAVPAITTDPAFANARERALSSSNLLVMVRPGVMANNDWFVGSMAIRETGVEMAVDGRTDDPQALKGARLAHLDPKLLDALPRGAYGFFAAAQVGPAVSLAGDALDDPSKEAKKEMDLDLRGDVLPALGGDLVVGLYPGFGPDAGLDLLVSMDDANGADPAVLARKLERTLDEKFAEGGPSEGKPEAWKTDLPLEGAQAERLSDDVAGEIRQGLREAERSFFRPLTLSRDKTVAWATVGKTVLMSSSQSLLARAVAARQNPSSSLGLSGDRAFGVNPAAAVDGQFAYALSMSRFVEGIRNTVDPSHMSAKDAQIYRKVLGLYDATTEPAAMRAGIDPDGRYHAFVSSPIDWSKLPAMFAK